MIKQFITIGKVKTIGELKDFRNKYDFFRDNIHDIEKFKDLFGEEKLLLSPDEIKKMKVRDTYLAEKRKIKKQVMEEATREIQEEIEKKKQEYLSIPSVIDGEIEEEPPIKKIKKHETTGEWWERFNLIENPFKVQEGLSQIPEEMYDDVVFKTPIYETYINRALYNCDELLYKGRPLLGDFGSGKSTLIDYLGFSLIEQKIKLFRIVLPPRADIVTLNIILENKLFDQLRTFFKSRFGYDFSGEPELNSIIQMFKMLEQNEGWNFIIVIDDLHKIIGGDEVVMNFLSSLQITKSEFNRNNIKVGFLVAGLPLWKKYLQEKGALKGFLDGTPDFMPEVTPELAYDVIKMRFKAFSKNPDINNTIDLDFLKQIYRKTVNDGFLGFRTFMTNIETELRDKGNYSIFESNPMEIPQETLNAINEMIEENKILKVCFNKYIFGSGIEANENRDHGLKILIKIYLDKGICDDDKFVIENKYHFQKLAYSNLINKISTDNKKAKWVLNPELYKLNSKVLKEYNLSLEDYLRPIFTTPVKKEIVDRIAKNRYENFINDNISGLKEYEQLLHASLGPYEKATKINMRKINFKEIETLITEWKTSLSQLSTCIFIIEGLTKPSSLTPDQILKTWSDYWNYPQQLKQFVDELGKFKGQLDQMPLIRRFYIEAFNELYEIFINNFEVNRKFNINLNDLNETEIELLNDCRLRFIAPYTRDNYFKLLKNLNEYLEAKIRVFLLIFLHLLYGERKNRLNQIKDNEVLRYIQKDPRLYDNPSYNEFENLNRGQYKKLFLENPNLKKSFIATVLGNNYHNNYKEFFEVFADTNIITSHLKYDSISSDLQSKIYSYLLKSIDFLKQLNKALLEIYNNYFYINEIKQDSVSCYFSLQGIKNEKINHKIFELGDEILKDMSIIDPVEITDKDYKRVFSTLSNLCDKIKLYYLNLEDYVLIERVFGIKYRNFIALLACLRYKEKIEIKDRFGAKVSIKIVI